MGRRFSSEYVHASVAAPGRDGLSALLSVLTSSDRYDPRAPNYGLPDPLFLLVETMSWEGAARSGVWTYYESTPLFVQERMCTVLAATAPAALAKAYATGMATWRSTDRAGAVDAWLGGNEASVIEWLRGLVAKNEALIDAVA
jgi:hypothetical protein